MSLETANDQREPKKFLRDPRIERCDDIAIYNFPIEDSSIHLIEKAVEGAKFLKKLIETHKVRYFSS